MLMHINGLQLEVLRCTTQRKVDEKDELASAKCNLIARSNDICIPAPLPDLPNEILARIFEHLYWLESTVTPKPTSDPGSPSEGFSTLQRLLHDDGTTPEWRSFINRQIPCVVATSDIEEVKVMPRLRLRLGFSPKLLSLLDLVENPEDILESQSTTILFNMDEPSKGIEELEYIRHKPWYNLLILQNKRERNPESKMIRAIEDLVQRFGDKLANLDELDFLENSPSVAFTLADSWSSTQVEAISLKGIVLKLARIRLPSQFLIGLHTRGILSNITTLKTQMPIVEALEPMMHIESFFQALAVVSSTLTCLSVSAASSEYRLLPIKFLSTDNHISLPQLKKLYLYSFTEGCLLQLLGAMQCRSLSFLTFTEAAWGNSSDKGIKGSLSVSFLHNRFPNLASISVCLGVGLPVRHILR